jgi:hypothetical protein
LPIQHFIEVEAVHADDALASTEGNKTVISMLTLSSEAKKSEKVLSEKSSTKPCPRTKSTRSSTRRRSMDRIELIGLPPRHAA